MVIQQESLPLLLHYSFLIPVFPLVSFAVIGLVVKPAAGKDAHQLSILMTLCSFLLSLGAASEYFGSDKGKLGEPISHSIFTWLTFSSGIFAEHAERLVVDVGVLLDPISLTLSLLVCFISLLAQIYSTSYLAGHSGYRRYFSYMSLFTGAMLALVLSINLVQMYVFWELVGLGSFLLIGYYFEKPSAVSACKKAFIVTRFADLGFLIGILIISYYTKSFDFISLPEKASALAPDTLKLACLLIALGAFGKSAMFPLHIWLPDAMEGPTPVSALIHAATMVVAGVYLIARLFGVFVQAEDVLFIIASVGAFTALFAAICACSQTDIKRILAFSTLSQIGYMMLALGVASPSKSLGYSAAMFHLTTHAFFKALLFLGAGAVIHAVLTNDIWKMGGLAKKMPVTHWTFLIACLAIAGFPFLSGFYSKDEILLAVQQSDRFALLATAVLVAGLTSFYMFRLYYLTFHGEESKASAGAHDPTRSMSYPLILLAVLSVVGGFLPVTEYVFFSGRETIETAHIGTPLLATVILVSALGWLVADRMYRKDRTLPAKVANKLGGFYRAASEKFYIDEVYLFVTKRIIFNRISKPLENFDKKLIDGNVDNVGGLTVKSGGILQKLSTGRVHGHIATIVFGSTVLILFFWKILF